MNPEKLSHIALRAALAGALKPLKGDGQPLPSEMVHRVWQWAESSFTINPELKLPDDLPLGASLLRDPEVSFCPEFFKNWEKRYGASSLFAEDGPTIPQFWAQRLVDSLKGDLSHRSRDASRVLAWVLENAPEGQLDRDLAREAFEMIEANRGSKTPLPVSLAGAISKELEKILGSHLDPLRPPMRWSVTIQDLEEGADLSMPVRLPSGRVRPLQDWVRLRSHRSAASPIPEIEESTLPTLPHRRRLDLAKGWVLDPEISIDKARARLWAATSANPASVWTLLEWMEEPPKRSPHYPERIAELFSARDPHGRSYLAFLTSGRAGDGDECEAIAKHLLDKSIVSRSSVYGEDGSGLVEQVFVGQRMGHSEDAFGNYFSAPEGWVLDLFGEGVYQGPASRYQDLEDDLTDSLLPGLGYHVTYTQALQKAFPSEKVWQASRWALINRDLSKKFETYNLPKKKALEATARAVGMLNERVGSLVKSIESNPGLLWIGEIEFNQFKTMIYPAALEGGSLVPHEFRTAVSKGIESLERATLFNSMHLEVDEAPSQATRRHRL